MHDDEETVYHINVSSRFLVWFLGLSVIIAVIFIAWGLCWLSRTGVYYLLLVGGLIVFVLFMYALVSVYQ